MNKYLILSIICFILGIILLGISAQQGDGGVAWVVVIPVIYGTGILALFGTILIILGIFLLMIGIASRWGSIEWGDLDDLEEIDHYKRPGDKPTRYKTRQPDRPARRTSIKHGGVVFLGPIPIIWGSDKKIAYVMAIVALILVIIFVLFVISWVI